MPFFLKGDIVQTKTGKEGKVIEVNDESHMACVYVAEEALTVWASDATLTMVKAVDGWGGFATAEAEPAGKGSFAPACTHWREEFVLPTGKSVYLSRLFSHKAESNGVTPTAGLYLDQGWLAKHPNIWTNAEIPAEWRSEGQPSILYLPWPDRGAVTTRKLSVAAAWALGQVEEGQALEIGCVGGHGRTGTMLAGILLYCGLDAESAIKEVRGSYCKKAIESKVQEELIGKLGAALQDKNRGKE